MLAAATPTLDERLAEVQAEGGGSLRRIGGPGKLRFPILIASDPVVDGPTDPSFVRRLLKASGSETRSCWEKSPEYATKEAKKAVFSWRIAEGSVEDAAYLGGDFATDGPFPSCVLDNLLGTLRFPKAESSTVYWAIQLS